MHAPTLQLLESKPPPPPGGAPQPAHARELRPPGAPLRCARCGHPITNESERREVEGRHVHTRFNPAGVVFDFGAFAHAPGARVEGEPTQEATWFPGCAWAYAHCGACGAHLGWHFSGAEEFFGLVLARLVGG